jgi:hypothetical protein
VVIKGIMKNLGPERDADVAEYFTNVLHLTVKREVCNGGVSPNRPTCEIGSLDVGQTTWAKVVTRVSGTRRGAGWVKADVVRDRPVGQRRPCPRQQLQGRGIRDLVARRRAGAPAAKMEP